LETYEAMSKDRLLAVAAGVVFYALLAIFPAITAFVSFYGLFANAGAVQEHLSMLANFMPSGGLTIVQEQIARIASEPSGLSVGFAVGLLIALWSANAGVKAMMDALNVIEGQDERRSFVRLNLLSLSLTFGAIVFLLLAVGAVVAFPLVMSAFGLKHVMDTATWLIRWPLLFVLLLGTLAVFYRFGPSREVSPRWWITPGAVIAALLWLAGSAALSFYLSNFADYNATYGSLGAAIGLMMWMWLSTVVVLLGAQLDTVIERKLPARN
jgi:membrane protein